MDDLLFYGFCGIVGIVVLSIIKSGFFTTPNDKFGMVTRFGKYLRTATPGLSFKVPMIDKVIFLSSRAVQVECSVSTKTLDNVMVTLPVAVQLVVSDPVKATYAFTDFKQVQAYTENIILGHVPTLNLDQVFESQTAIALQARKELQEEMNQFGYKVIKVLITDIEPDEKVMAAMNEINAAQREQVAAKSRGEAEKILQVKQSEGEAESAINHGRGVAGERIEIAKGIAESSRLIKEANPDVDDSQVLLILLATQWTEAQKVIGTSDNSTTVFLNGSPGGVGDMLQQLQATIMNHGSRQLVEA